MTGGGREDADAPGAGAAAPAGAARPVVVAIDGPAGSGKSTVAGALARRLGVPHVDTGAYYRAATLAVIRAGTAVRDAGACAAVVGAARIERRGGRTFLDGEDVEEEIRGPVVTGLVSAVSAVPAVRAALLDAQRAGVGTAGGVVEGRDAGTVVVPDAPLKVWLTATPLERALRRVAQLGQRGGEAVAQQAADIARRDAADAAQMAKAADVVVIDTSGRSVPSLVADLEQMARAAARSEEGQP